MDVDYEVLRRCGKDLRQVAVTSGFRENSGRVGGGNGLWARHAISRQREDPGNEVGSGPCIVIERFSLKVLQLRCHFKA